MNNSDKENFDDLYKENYLKSKADITIEATNLLAARIIANKNFPGKDTLPRFVPLPFNHFGFHYLFDQTRYLTIIYQTILEYKKLSKKSMAGTWFWVISLGLLGLVVLMFGFGESEIAVMGICLISIAVIVYFVASGYIDESINRKIKSYKAKVIEELLEDQWVKKDEIEIPDRYKKDLEESNKIDISSTKIPVLTIFDDKHPFPGFGMLQLENTFICPPKSKSKKTDIKENEVLNLLISKVETSLNNCGIDNLGFGKVVILSYDSITVDSPWLDSEKKPIKAVDLHELEEINKTDGNASARTYFFIDVLFPRYKSAASFFVRVFKAGNSIGCHVALTTIGPPEYGCNYFRNKLTKYKKELDGITNNSITSDRNNIKEKELYSIKLKADLEQPLHNPQSLSDIADMDPFEEKDFNEEWYNKNKTEILKYDSLWPGRYYFFRYNERERNSLTFGGDFFGKPELIGSIRTVYDQVSKIILDFIEASGFDISNYKDKEGNYSINAGNIDKLIVGEVINMKSEDKNSEKVNSGKPNTESKE